MIKLIDLLENKILVPRRSPEERSKNYIIATQKKIQQYIKDGSKGDLDLRNTPITSLPQGLTVGGDLNLMGTKLTSLPQGLKVGSYLDLQNTLITSLPQGLTVGGNLNLYGTKVTTLPQGLTVGGGIYSYDTEITALPKDLKVGSFLDLSNTPLSKKYSEEQIKQMVPGVKGSIYL